MKEDVNGSFVALSGNLSRRGLLGGVAFCSFFAGSQGIARMLTSKPTPPVTPRYPIWIEQLGRSRVDNYAWLKPANWRDVWRDSLALDPAIRSHLEEENRYVDAVLEPAGQIQADLLREMKALSPQQLDAPAELDGPWAYLTNYAAGGQHPRYLRRARAGGAEALLLDGEARARGQNYFAMDYPTLSPDHSLFAWAEDNNGAERYTIRVKDIATGEIYPDGPQSAFGTFVFSPDSQWLFWTWRDDNSRPARLYRRPARGGKDTLVYEEPDPGMFMEVRLSASGRYVLIRSWGLITTEMRFIDAAAPQAEPTLVAPRREGVEYEIEHWGDRFIIRTNEDGAEDFKLMWTPVDRPHRNDWQPWVPHRPGRYIVEMRAFAATFVWLERIEGNAHLVATGADGTQREPIAFTEAAYKLTVAPCEYAGNTIRLIYESPRLPRQWLSCDLATGRRETLALETVSTANAPDRYVLQRLHATMRDGAVVPITILYRKGTKLDGTAPLLLTGYGSYGVSDDAVFSAPALSLVDRGWIWAVAHVRGGSEKGWNWFEQARQLRKKISFTDLVSCAQTLISSGHGAAGRIVLHVIRPAGCWSARPTICGPIYGPG